MAIHRMEQKAMIELSVVIPTYNRVERLQACLEALTRQTQPASDFEVIVVVDGSTDGTHEMLKSLSTPFSLTILFQENQGQQVARNHGVEYARGRYCLFVDDDIMAGPALVAEHLRLHRQRERVVGIGRIALAIPERPDWFTENFAKGWHQHYEELNQNTRTPAWYDCYGGNMSVERSLFLDAGGFAPDIRRSHDIELGYRLGQNGLTFVYLMQAVGWQDERKGVRELAADAEKSGAAWVKLYKRHPEMYSQLLEPFIDVSMRESILRKILWFLRLPPPMLDFIGRMLQRLKRDRKWYRFLFSYFYWRGFWRDMANRSSRWDLNAGGAILMYHAFAERGETASRFILPIEHFVRQMEWLKRLGYRVISLDDFMQHYRKHDPFPAHSVVITIDDGYAEIRTLVYPVLQRFGFPATVFMVSEKVGAYNDWANHKELRGRRLMSREAIKEMSRDVILIGAHTRTHPNLTKIPLEQAKEEVAGSKSDLERAFGFPIHSFAYPFGEYNPLVQALVEQAGFLAGYTADNGLNTLGTPQTALRRIEIEGTWSLPRFLLALLMGSAGFRWRSR